MPICISAFLEFINLSKFLCRGILHNFSSTFSPASSNCFDSLSLFEKRPAYSEPKETIIAPVKVAKSTMNFGLNFFSVNVSALTFTEKKFKPKFIVDLATLTGAIIVSLGSEYAGLFSNNDKLSKQLLEAGEKVEEKLWRMPLHKNFDKLINSKNADMHIGIFRIY